MLLYGGEYWFLYTIFIVYAIYLWLDKLCKSLDKEIALLLVLILIRQFVPIISFLAINRVLTYLPYFCLGHIIYRCVMKKDFNVKKPVILVLLSAMLYVFFYLILKEMSVSVWCITYIEALAFCTCVALVVSLINKVSKHAALERLVVLCGNYSLQLYLFNMYLEVALRILICKLFRISMPFAIIGLSSVLNGYYSSDLQVHCSKE